MLTAPRSCYHSPSLLRRSLYRDHMKVFCLSLALLCYCAESRSVSAQTSPPKNSATVQTPESSKASDPPANPGEDKSAAQLFEEADNYVRRKFEAFEKLKMPYDDQL